MRLIKYWDIKKNREFMVYWITLFFENSRHVMFYAFGITYVITFLSLMFKNDLASIRKETKIKILIICVAGVVLSCMWPDKYVALAITKLLGW